jgi:mRNA-degrading endonuclease RelE of RelBE toxin-antitoxin system
MDVLVTLTFEQQAKKLHKNQKHILDQVIRAIAENPDSGESKKADLSGISVYKFLIGNQEWLLAYRIISDEFIKLLLVGPHENFYRNLKRKK